MSKKIKNSLQIFNVIMFIATCGVAFYVTTYAPTQLANQKETIYIAKEDVPANVLIDNNILSKSFESKNVSKNDLLPSYFISTDKEIYTNNKITKGEPLMLTQLKHSQDIEGNYEVKLQPNFVGKLDKNDFVQVFVQIVNGKTGESSIHTLFPQKQVKTIEYLDESVNSVNGVYVNLTEQELMDYYKAREKGKIILGKLTNVESNTDSIKVIDFESDEFKNAELVDEGNIQETILEDTKVEDVTIDTDIEIEESGSTEIEEYTVLKDETWKGIAAKNGTDEETLKEINLGVELKENEIIFVPVK